MISTGKFFKLSIAVLIFLSTFFNVFNKNYRRCLLIGVPEFGGHVCPNPCPIPKACQSLLRALTRTQALVQTLVRVRPTLRCTCKHVHSEKKCKILNLQAELNRFETDEFSIYRSMLSTVAWMDSFKWLNSINADFFTFHSQWIKGSEFYINRRNLVLYSKSLSNLKSYVFVCYILHFAVYCKHRDI